MYKLLKEKVTITRIAVILTAAMLFNIFVPIIGIRPVWATGSGRVDVANYLTQVSINNSTSSVDPAGTIEASMWFNVPDNTVFNAENPYLVYDFGDIIALKLNSDGTTASSGSPAIDLSDFDSSALNGYINFTNSTLPANTYTYTIVSDPSSPDYGKLIMDMTPAFNEDGTLRDTSINGQDGSFAFALGLDETAFEDNAASYALTFSHLLNQVQPCQQFRLRISQNSTEIYLQQRQWARLIWLLELLAILLLLLTMVMQKQVLFS